MRSGIYKCPCGEVYFADPVNPNPCPSCKKQNVFPFYIKTYRYNLPVHQRTKLYACHTEKDSDDFETLSGEVSSKGDFELKNVSDKNWTVTDGDNSSSVAPNVPAVTDVFLRPIRKNAKHFYGRKKMWRRKTVQRAKPEHGFS
jgi:hypothetical protein